MRLGDVLLAYPYESMRPVIELLREASEDRTVVSIRMTLYRIGSQSQIVQYLCAAAENGKDVTVIVELRARFDEQNNINWATVMEEAGCKVIYGIDEYKVHAKLLLITRVTRGGPEYITNVATGNYNEGTARFYADLSLLTASRETGEDAVQFFQDLSIGNVSGRYRTMLTSPLNLKPAVIGLIDAEAQKAAAGESGRIIFKMNSLTDRDVMDALIRASQAGVKISLIIRGICCLRAGVPGYTENIEVCSIVGRFLEHARIYSFGEASGSRILIGSEDMMTRNTERRIEILAEVRDERLKTRLRDMLRTQLKDNVKARLLRPDGSYTPVDPAGERIDSQAIFYEQAYTQLALAAARAPEAGKPRRLFFRGLRRKPPAADETGDM